MTKYFEKKLTKCQRKTKDSWNISDKVARGGVYRISPGRFDVIGGRVGHPPPRLKDQWKYEK